MCGIVGIASNKAGDYRKQVDGMLQSIAHRGPDGSGTYLAPSGNCLLGHRRLAIIDLSEQAAQPMQTTDGRYALSYNGECYNFESLRSELPPMASSGDSSVVLHTLAREGTDAFARFNGMFALALWDNQEQRLTLARDRFGQKPLYYCETKNGLIFSSEIRALLQSGLCSKEINPHAIESYLRFGSIQGPDTLFREIQLLPPASYLTWEAGSTLQIQPYWTPGHQQEEASSQSIREGLIQAVDRHLISDAPIGLFLSGGLDSSAILAAAHLANKRREQEIHALTIGFPDQPEADESQLAQAMVRKVSGVKHSIIPVSAQDCSRSIHGFLNALDQPSLDGLNTWIIAEKAKEIGLKSALSGIGSDELFGGYSTFNDIPHWLKTRHRIGLLRSPALQALKCLPTFSRVKGKLTDLLQAPAHPLDFYFIRRQVFSQEQRQALLAPLGGRLHQELPNFEQLSQLGQKRSLYDQIRLWELYGYMNQTLLRDADTMGMHHGLEIRMPFLDNDFSETMLAQAPPQHSPQGLAKKQLIDAIGNEFPKAHLEQSKKGFQIPLTSLLQNELRDLSEASLAQLKAMDTLFNPASIDTFWKAFLDKPNKIGVYRPWILVVLGHYLNQLS